MSDLSFDVATEACRMACANLNNCAILSKAERASAPLKIREYVDALVSSGESDPEKISRCALGLVREFEQISRSEARVNSPSIVS